METEAKLFKGGGFWPTFFYDATCYVVCAAVGDDAALRNKRRFGRFGFSVRHATWQVEGACFHGEIEANCVGGT